MTHFVKVENEIVKEVIVSEQDFIDTGVLGDPVLWVQTSYNTRGGIHYGVDGQPDGGQALRANYAGIGYTYDKTNDVFYAPRPLDKNNVSCESWTVGAPSWLWTPPIPMPTDGKVYAWDESTKTWNEVVLS